MLFAIAFSRRCQATFPMTTITRKVDQWVLIGTDLQVSPTDIDPKSVRLLAKGRRIGGPEDGQPFHSAHELSKGQSLPLGPMVVVTVLDLPGDRVTLGILAPPHLPVLKKEDAAQGKDTGGRE